MAASDCPHRFPASGVTRLDAEPYSQLGLIGREVQLEMVRTFLDKAAAGGVALSLSGEAGVGKTVLLDAAAVMSSAADFCVLRTVGIEFETNLSFSGLNEILSPLWSSIGRVESVYQEALRVALGFGAGSRPDELLILNAAMALLGQAALRRPLLVIIDDAQWIDRASLVVLAYAARRGVAGVGFLCATRSGHNCPFEFGGVPSHVLQSISDTAAAKLLDWRFPTVAPRVRQRLIVEAAGNPLALMELPTALTAAQLTAVDALPGSLPLSVRLQGLFEARITGLPQRTLDVLLLAALDGPGELRVLRVAADVLEIFDDLAPAERDRLIFVDDVNQRVNFRHPLIRSTVVELSTGGERREAHRALAGALLDQPDRHAWHLAEATLDPDEQVAAMLDQVATRMLGRGDLAGAVTASTRAASLTPISADRARRLAFAAYHGARLGEFLTSSQLVEVARETDPEFAGSLRDAVTAVFLLFTKDGHISTIHRLLTEALRSHPAPWDTQDEVVIEALHTLALVCWVSGNPDWWKSFRETVPPLIPHVPAALLLRHTVFGDPARATATSLTQLERALVELPKETDPTAIMGSARYLDRQNLSRETLQRIVLESGAGEVVGACARRDLALDCFLAGQWVESERLANEGLVRALEQRQWLRTGEFRYVLALLAAVRGDDDSNRALCDELTSVAIARGALNLQHGSLHARALAAIGRGDFEQGYRFAAAVSPPGTFPSHVGEALFVCMDLVEAAIRTHRREEANAHVAAMREGGIAELSPRLALLAAGSAALTHPDKIATELFEQALAVPGTERWPFDRARVQLAYGERLRRTRSSTSRSRAHLSAAWEVFERIGAHPWARRADNELRATGQVRSGHVASPVTGGSRVETSCLTVTEFAVARLVSKGLTNVQVGKQLFISTHTVAFHLKKIFPKLNVASRVELASVWSQIEVCSEAS
jgi:DNA-binding CsgD family transcriptional regulator